MRMPLVRIAPLLGQNLGKEAALRGQFIGEPKARHIPLTTPLHYATEKRATLKKYPQLIAYITTTITFCFVLFPVLSYN